MFSLSNVFTSETFDNHILQDNIKEHKERNPNIKERERPVIFRFIIL